MSASVFRTNERNKKVVSRSRLPRVTCSTASQQPGTAHKLKIYFVQDITVSVQAEGHIESNDENRLSRPQASEATDRAGDGEEAARDKCAVQLLRRPEGDGHQKVGRGGMQIYTL